VRRYGDLFANELRLQNRTESGPETYVFGTRDGLLSKDKIRGSERTLIEEIEPDHDDDVLNIDANYGVVGIVLARLASGGRTAMTEPSARAADCCRTNATRNGSDNAVVELTADVSNGRSGFNIVAHAPKPYEPTEVVKEKIAQGLSRLAPSGTYYLAGSEQSGVRRYANALSTLAGECERFCVSDNTHFYQTERPADYVPQSYIEDHEFRATVGDYTCRFLTRPGLFSATELDDGTATLLQHATVQDGDRVLDCCCGYGAIGAFIGARTDCSLWATDDDRVATSYARLNFERNGVSAEDVRTGDCLDAVSDQTFDTVLSNPPTHAGSGVTQKLFTGVREVIAENGVFYLVANQIMDYDDTLSGGFDFDAEVVAETGNFDVIRAYPT